MNSHDHDNTQHQPDEALHHNIRLDYANLGTTSIDLQGIDTEDIIATVHAWRAPMMSATARLQL